MHLKNNSTDTKEIHYISTQGNRRIVIINPSQIVEITDCERLIYLNEEDVESISIVEKPIEEIVEKPVEEIVSKMEKATKDVESYMSENK